MREENEMEKTLNAALYGIPQIKPHEKAKWLGEFRENVIIGLTKEDTGKEEAYKTVEKYLQDPDAEILILNNSIPHDLISKYIKLVKKMNKEFKSVNAEKQTAMGLVVAGSKAVNRKNAVLKIKGLPFKFKNIRHKELCSKCYEELMDTAPEYKDEFKELNTMDKLLGIKCGACQKKTDSGPLI